MSEADERATDYDFDLADDLIAQEPPEARGGQRDQVRLAVLHRRTGKVEHRGFRDLSEYLGVSDVLVLNNARVVPTLLHGQDQDGRAVVLSVHSPTGDRSWHCLVAPAAAVLFPSAGRHFTPAILGDLKARGVAIAEVTLLIAARSHYWVRAAFRQRVAEGAVGDVESEDRVAASATGSCIDFPRAERYELSAATADVINERRRAGGRVMVCGTSALRTLETVADDTGLLWPQQGFTQLTISPGHQFRACDAFLTNLHRPMSSELVLTAAFAGRELLLETYHHQIIPRGYHFYEFGDSMVIV
jgi:S-adenosylmethionine:tRNA-ribosyltransferase-isomerase (queuine synthetase)